MWDQSKNRLSQKTNKGTPPQILFLRGFPGKAVYDLKEELVNILNRIFDIALLLVRARRDDVGILIIRGCPNKLEKNLQLVENPQ